MSENFLSEEASGDLLGLIHLRQVIPIIGSEMVTVPDPVTGVLRPLPRSKAPALAQASNMKSGVTARMTGNVGRPFEGQSAKSATLQAFSIRRAAPARNALFALGFRFFCGRASPQPLTPIGQHNGENLRALIVNNKRISVVYADSLATQRRASKENRLLESSTDEH